MVYEGDILRKIVKYCYTDKVSLPEENSENNESTSFETKQAMLLMDAADYFNLPGLVSKILKCLMTEMANNFEMAWKVLVYCDENPSSSIDSMDMYEAAMQMVQQDFGKVLHQSDDIPILSPKFLKRILAYENAVADEIDRFRFIQLWCFRGSHDGSAKDTAAAVVETGGNESTNGISSSKEAGTPQEEGDRTVDPPVKKQKTSQYDEAQPAEERRKVACGLVERRVHLASIKLQDLRGKVEPSGLVKAEFLREAYKSDAIRADIISQVVSETHYRPVWKRSNSRLLTGRPRLPNGRLPFDVLSCDSMKSGSVHIWSIEVVKGASRRLRMGVIASYDFGGLWWSLSSLVSSDDAAIMAYLEYCQSI
jgi:hypothetical protein